MTTTDITTNRTLTRTNFLKAGAGAALFVYFGAPALTGTAKAQVAAGLWPNVDPRRLDNWIMIHPDNTVTLFHGKVDLGQGIETTFMQIVAEELDVSFKQMRSVVGDTARTVHQGGASGSTAVTGGGPAVRNAAAEARRVLVEAASRKLDVPVSQLSV